MHSKGGDAIMNGAYICPKCGEILEQKGKSLVCSQRHTYDIAGSGYVNLLLSQQMNAKLPGDNKLMVNARKNFLSKGYYSILAEKLCETVRKYTPENGLILDAGCGEGYYTVNAAKSVPNAFIMGTDISKTAVMAASKRAKAENAENILFSVSSVFHMPIKSESCDIVTTVFAPYCGEEFIRVLKSGGILIMVIPSERHLWELKEAVYDKPYLNEVKDYSLDGFEIRDNIKVCGKIQLDSKEDIQSLFSMTPYYYKTSREGHKRLDELESLSTRIEFEILIYEKKKPVSLS